MKLIKDSSICIIDQLEMLRINTAVSANQTAGSGF